MYSDRVVASAMVLSQSTHFPGSVGVPVLLIVRCSKLTRSAPANRTVGSALPLGQVSVTSELSRLCPRNVIVFTLLLPVIVGRVICSV